MGISSASVIVEAMGEKSSPEELPELFGAVCAAILICGRSSVSAPSCQRLELDLITRSIKDERRVILEFLTVFFF